jgi:hypothetical protein
MGKRKVLFNRNKKTKNVFSIRRNLKRHKDNKLVIDIDNKKQLHYCPSTLELIHKGGNQEQMPINDYIDFQVDGSLLKIDLFNEKFEIKMESDINVVECW